MTIDTRGRHDGYPDPGTSGWYVTDPSTGLTQYVEADAECTARGRLDSLARLPTGRRAGQGGLRRPQGDFRRRRRRR